MKQAGDREYVFFCRCHCYKPCCDRQCCVDLRYSGCDIICCYCCASSQEEVCNSVGSALYLLMLELEVDLLKLVQNVLRALPDIGEPVGIVDELLICWSGFITSFCVFCEMLRK